MKFELLLLRFYARVWDPAAETNREEPVTLTKDHLRAAGLVGQSSKELIRRVCERRGLQLLDPGTAERRTVTLDLDALWGMEQGSTLDLIEMMEEEAN